jgi:hypothetical protein
MWKLLVLFALPALVASQQVVTGDYKLLLNNIGEKDGLSLYFVGNKQAPGPAMPETTAEYFTDFIEFGKEVAHFAVGTYMHVRA